MAKRYRDAVNGEFIKEDEAMARKNESIAETVKPRKPSTKKPKKPVEPQLDPDFDMTDLVVMDKEEYEKHVKPKVDFADEVIEEVTSREEAKKRAFKLNKAWIYKGEICVPGKEAKVTKEAEQAIKKKEGE